MKPDLASPISSVRPPASDGKDALAVLCSGGLDSAVLLVMAARRFAAIHPLYVRCGLAWEGAELRRLDEFLGAVSRPALRALTVLDLPVIDLQANHWSVTGDAVPDAASPDEAVFLPGRNVLLLCKALLWCHLNGVPALALATLRSNPFPDATASFFAEYSGAVNRAVGGAVLVRRPYAELTKPEVILLGRDLPLELTFSCLRPAGGFHCGSCNKCAERRRAFAEAGVTDKTRYLPAHASA